MSVINTMLRDLEQRQGQTADGRYQPPMPARWRRWIAPLLLCISLPLLGWLSWQRLQAPGVVVPPSSTATPAAQPALTAAASSATAVAPVSTPVAVAHAVGQSTRPVTASAAVVASVPRVSEVNHSATEVSAARAPTDVAPVAQSKAVEVPPAAERLAPSTDAMTSAATKPAVSDEQLLGPDEGPGVTEASLLRSDNAVSVAAEPPGELSIREQHLSASQIADLERNKGLVALARGDTAQARAAFDVVLRNAPLDHEIRARLVGLLYGDGDVAGARQQVATGIHLAPMHADYRLLDARLALAQGDRAGALATLAALDPPVRENLDYYATRAGLAQSLGDDAQAIRCYQQLTAARPQEGRWWMGLGISLERVQRGLAAREAYQHAADQALSAEARQFVKQRLQQLEKSS